MFCEAIRNWLTQKQIRWVEPVDYSQGRDLEGSSERSWKSSRCMKGTVIIFLILVFSEETVQFSSGR